MSDSCAGGGGLVAGAGVHRCAAVVSVGDELILGQTLDTNSRWVSDRLMGLGVLPVEHVTVGDDCHAQQCAFARLAERVDLIVCTGGLGPTADDLTREALAGAMRDELVEDAAALEQVRAWFAARSRAMPALNAVQARRPRRGECLQNRYGTAPGLWGVIELAGGVAGGRRCDVVCLPGPPRELIGMWGEEVVQRIRPQAGRVIRTRSVATIGIGESDLATRLGVLMERNRNPLVGTTASGGHVHCRVRFDGAGSVTEADAAVAACEHEVRKFAGIYALRTDSIQHEVVELLRAVQKTMVGIESCTAGMMCAMVGDVPGASAVLRGGVVAYANEMKESLVGVPRGVIEGHGAVSEEVARAMAVGGRERLGADYAVSITGVAGPDGGSELKPVGTVWIAVADAAGVEARRFAFSGDRSAIREWSARMGLAMLRLRILAAKDVALLREAR